MSGYQGDPTVATSQLVIDGASLSGVITHIDPLGGNTPTGSTVNSSLLAGSAALPVALIDGATLNASTELDLVSVDPGAQPNVQGSSQLTVDNSTINAGQVVIATGANGLGSGNPGGSAELDLTNNSSMAVNNTLYVGDTSNGYFNVSNSKVQDQQAIIANDVGSYGSAVITDAGSWTNNGYLTVGQNAMGQLLIENGAQVFNTGLYGNGYIAGLAGSDGSTATVTGPGSLWQLDSSLVVGNQGTAGLLLLCIY